MLEFVFTETGTFKHKTLYPTVFDKAEILCINDSLSDMRLKNTTEALNIILNDINLKRNDKITIDFEEGTIKKNGGQNVIKHLNLRSHLEDYGANYLDEFECKGCEVTMYFKEKRL